MPQPASHFAELGRDILANQRPGHGLCFTGDKFRSMYGCSPEICAILWNIVERQCSIYDNVHPKHLLWALLFLKLYLPIQVAVAFIGCDEKTYQRYVWVVIDGIRYARCDTV